MASKFYCPWEGCTQSYSAKSSVKAHYDVEHAGVRFVCETCGDAFKSKRSREAHTKTKHLKLKNWRKSAEIKCPHPECSDTTKTYATKQGLQRHITSRHSDEEFPCGECDLSFSNPAKLAYHQKHEHQGLRFSCVDCGDDFASNQLLHRHIERSPLCSFRTAKKAPRIEVERKRKLGEIEDSPAAIFLKSIPEKIKNSTPQECRHDGCSMERLGYGFRGGDKIYCINHQHDEDGVEDLGKLSLCVFKGCARRGHNTVKDTNHYRFCAPHRDLLISEGLPVEEVIFGKNTSKCDAPGCTVVPSYDGRKYCKSHSPTGVSDDQRKCGMVCCADGGPRPQYVHPDNGTAICAFAARALMEVALMENDMDLAEKLMRHFKRSSMLVLNQQSAFRVAIEKLYWNKLDTCSKVYFDDTVSDKPKTAGDLRPDIFYMWEVDGEKMAIHIEYDEGKGQHEDNESRIRWIAETSGTLGSVYVIRIDAKSGSSAELCTRTKKGSVVYYTVNSTGKKVAAEVAQAVMQRIEWIKKGLAPDDGALRPYKLYM